MTDVTNHPNQDMLSYLEARGYRSRAHERFTAIDLETIFGILREVDPKDRMGLQMDLFTQDQALVKQAAWSTKVFNPILGRKPLSIPPQGEVHIQYTKAEMRAARSEIITTSMAQGMSRKEARKYLQEAEYGALHAQQIGAGKPFDLKVARQGERKTLATITDKRIPADFSEMLEELFGPHGRDWLTGHNITHEKAMLRGYKPDISFRKFDTAEFLRAAMPQLGIRRTGAYGLENIRTLMTFLGTEGTEGEVRGQVIQGSNLETDLAKQIRMDVVDYYNPDVIDSVRRSFKLGFGWMTTTYAAQHKVSIAQATTELLAAQAHATGTEGVWWHEGIKKAIFAETERVSKADQAVALLFRRAGILPGATMQQILSHKRKVDPQNVQQYMEATSGKSKASLMHQLNSEHAVILDDVQGFRRGGFKQLFKTIEDKFGRRMAGHIRGVAARLGRDLDDPMFLLRKTRYGWTSLAFGERGQVESFIPMYLQEDAGLVYMGDEVRQAGNLQYADLPQRGGRYAGRPTVFNYSDIYYDSLQQEAKNRRLVSKNVGSALYSLHKLAHESSPLLESALEAARESGKPSGILDPRSDKRTIKLHDLQVKHLLASTPYQQSKSTIDAALHGGLLADLIGGPGDDAKRLLDEANRELTEAVGTSDVEGIKKALKKQRRAARQLAKFLNESGYLKEFAILTKGEVLHREGALKFPIPAAKDILAATTAEPGAFAKGHRARYTAGVDLSIEQRAMLKEAGVYVGDYLQTEAMREMQSPGILATRMGKMRPTERELRSKGVLSARQGGSTIEAMTAVMTFHGKNAGTVEMNMFADSGILATTSGMGLSAERQFEGSIVIPGAPGSAQTDLETLLGRSISGKNQLHNNPIYLQDLSKTQKAAGKRLRGLRTTGSAHGMWDQFLAGEIGLTAASIGDDIDLKFHHRAVTAPKFANILIGSGSTRVEVHRVITDPALQGIHFIGPSSTIKTAPMEILNRHRLGYGRQLGLGDEMARFLGVRQTKDAVLMPYGMTDVDLHEGLGRYKRHLAGLPSRTAAQKELLTGFEVIPFTEEVQRGLAEEAGIPYVSEAQARRVGNVDPTVFSGGYLVTSVNLRTTTHDITKSVTSGIKITTQEMRIMMGGHVPGYGSPIVHKLLNELLKKQTGFEFSESALRAPEDVKTFISHFGDFGAEADILLYPEGGRFRVGGPKAGKLLGKFLTIPHYDLREGRTLEYLTDTILDPALSKHTMVVVPPEPFEVTMGRDEFTRIGHLPVPPERIHQAFTTDAQGRKIVKYSAKSLLGTYLGALHYLALYPDELDKIVGIKGSVGFKRPTTIRDYFQGTPGTKSQEAIPGALEFIIRGARTGQGKGYVAGASVRVREQAVSVRPTHLTSDIIGGPTQLENWLAGKAIDGSRVDDAYIAHADAERWLHEQLGGHKDERFKKILKRLRSDDYNNNYLDIFVQTSPAHGAQRSGNVRLRASKRMDSLGIKSEIGMAFGPSKLFKMTRDLDLDSAKTLIIESLLEAIGPDASYAKTEVRQAIEIEREVNALRNVKFFGEWAGLTDRAALRSSGEESLVVQDILTGGKPLTTVTELDILQRFAGKGLPQYPYQQLRPLWSLLETVMSASLEGLERRLVTAGFGTTSEEAAKSLWPFIDDTISGSLSPRLDRQAWVAHEAISEYFQAGVKKGGKFLAVVHSAMIGIAEAKVQARAGAGVSQVIATMEKAMKGVEFDPGDITLALENLSKQAGRVVTPGEMIGKVFGTLIHITSQKGVKWRDLSMVVEKSMESKGFKGIAAHILGQELADLTFGDYTPLVTTTEEMERQMERHLARQGGTQAARQGGTQAAAGMVDTPSTSPQARTIMGDTRAGLLKAESQIAEFAKSDAGRWALYGGLTLGAYALIKGMFGDDEYAPPPITPQQGGAPMPPPPLLDQPQDRGIRSLPSLGSPLHPAPLPRHTMSRVSFGGRTNNSSFQDHTSPIDRFRVERQMREIGRSDFVRTER